MFREQNFDIRKFTKDIRAQQLEQQRKNWNEFSKGWKKWDKLIMQSMKPIGDALISELDVRGNEKVLDVASGTGEPGLTLSAMLPEGQVTGTDLSENMVSIANHNSAKRNILNYRSQACDAANLPFKDKTFDHIIYRFGIMFFPDLQKGLDEMVRVTKRGGKMALAVWGAPEKNPFITIMASTIIRKLDLPKPPPDSPGIFRCAKPGFTSELLQEAGMKNITEINHSGFGIFDSGEHYWDVMSDVAGPLMEALEKASQEKIEDVRSSVIESARKYTFDKHVLTPWEAIIVTGVKR